MKFVEATIPNAEIYWVNEIEAVPKTTKRDGNVTINNMGSPGRPGYFSVSFRMNAKFETGEISESLWFTPTVPIIGATKDISFGELEDQAMHELPAMFRALADDIERQITTWDAGLEDDSSTTTTDLVD